MIYSQLWTKCSCTG